MLCTPSCDVGDIALNDPRKLEGESGSQTADLSPLNLRSEVGESAKF